MYFCSFAYEKKGYANIYTPVQNYLFLCRWLLAIAMQLRQLVTLQVVRIANAAHSESADKQAEESRFLGRQVHSFGLAEHQRPRSGGEYRSFDPGRHQLELWRRVQLFRAIFPRGGQSVQGAGNVVRNFFIQSVKIRDFFQEIDGHSLLLMKRIDVLTSLKLKLGPALKIYRHIVKLQVRRDDPKLYWLWIVSIFI